MVPGWAVSTGMVDVYCIDCEVGREGGKGIGLECVT